MNVIHARQSSHRHLAWATQKAIGRCCILYSIYNVTRVEHLMRIFLELVEFWRAVDGRWLLW